MSKTAVFCITQSRIQAERIIERLNTSGFAYSDISAIMSDNEPNRDIGHIKATKAPEGSVTGAATGGIAGSVFGLLAGMGALAIPGVGPFVAAGPILSALSGAAIGAATGGVVGGLIGLGIPEIEAKIYEEKLKNGNFLIAVHTHTDGDIERVKEIYRAEKAEDIASTSEVAVSTH
jgi:hypothetical protein